MVNNCQDVAWRNCAKLFFYFFIFWQSTRCCSSQRNGRHSFHYLKKKKKKRLKKTKKTKCLYLKYLLLLFYAVGKCESVCGNKWISKRHKCKFCLAESHSSAVGSQGRCSHLLISATHKLPLLWLSKVCCKMPESAVKMKMGSKCLEIDSEQKYSRSIEMCEGHLCVMLCQ